MAGILARAARSREIRGGHLLIASKDNRTLPSPRD